MLGGNKFRCSKLSGHGAVNLLEAVKHSCNSYVFAIAKQIGARKIIEVAKKFGFGTLTNIDLPGELSGFVPEIDWKKEKFGTSWTLGDTFNLAIGQGFMLTTPMQIARFMAAIASDGKLFTPRIAKGETEFTQLNISKKHLDIIKNALYHTTNSSGGTGYLSRLDHPYIKMSGKTGTAQVRAKRSAADNLSRENIDWESRNHAIFAGYAPSSDPEYVVSVYYDHGGGGGRAAAPIAKKVMEEILRKYKL